MHHLDYSLWTIGWTDIEKGYVLSAFYWGYAAGQLPASRLASRFGAKWLFGFSVLVPSFLTLLVPIACRYSTPLAYFIRALIGIVNLNLFNFHILMIL